MKTKQQPFISVVVICYNGAHTIARTLDSLIAQKYPKSRFEIIVVDDGSTDNLSEVMQSYSELRFIQLPENLGISGARNAAIKAVKGDIYASFDDDCIADPKWLSGLAKGYERPDAVGVGGYITEPKPLKGLMRKYINATGAGTPPQIVTAESSVKLSLPKRLARYVRSSFSPLRRSKQEPVIPVEELYGANGSYPISVLRKVKGWDEKFSGIEDRDLSRRILAQYPKKRFYAVRDAKIVHDPALSLWQYLKRPYRRGPVNLKFHQRYGLLPPIFPFPILTLALAVGVGLVHPLYAALALAVVPQLLYARWLFNFFKTGRPINLLFPYVQMSEESMVIAGLIRGYGTNFRSAHLLTRKLLRPGLLLQLLLIVGWMTMELRSDKAGALQTLASIMFLLAVPGYVMLRALIGYATKLNLSTIVTYAVGIGIITLMLTGLTTNELFVLAGWQHPLSLRPLTFAVGGVSAVAAILAAWRKPAKLSRPALPWRTLRNAWLPVLMALALPCLAAGGAITLNNGGSGWLASLAMGLSGLFFLSVLWKKKTSAPWLTPMALYSICLSVLLGTSLRGWHITGHDIMQEYQVFELTLQHAAWHMSYYQDAYNACLSITILPTVFQRLTGMSDPFVYKFIFQLFFALVAPAMYNTLRHFTTRRTALLAVFVFLTFPAFLTDITMLNRQETALLCFVLALQAGLDTKLAKRGRLLTFVFLSGMVLSHYSTSYVAVGALLIMTALYPVAWLVRRIFRVPASKKQIVFPLPIILATVVLLITWGSLVTQTSGNISRTLSGVATGLPALLGGTTNPKEDSYSRIGTTKSSESVMKQYFESAKTVRTLQPYEYYQNATALSVDIQSKTDTVNPVRPALANRHVSAGLLYGAYDHIKQLYGVFIEGLIGLGAIFILFVRPWRTKLPLQYQLLILASLIAIGIQVVIPASLINYGLLRVIQQGLVVLALPLVLVCLWLLGLLRLPRHWQQQVLGVILVGFYFVLAGLLPTITGGYKPTLALSNSGFYYEAYYTHASEISADTWLAQKTPKGSRVDSDEFARRKMIAYAGIFAQANIVPEAVPIDSYVYLSYGDTSRGVVPAYYNGTLLYYAIPSTFLNTDKNLLYSSSSVQIYK